MVLPRGCAGSTTRRGDALLFVGDDWAETHHDVELMDTAGRRLAKARVPEGVAGMARLHVMIAEQLGEDIDEAQVAVGIETDRGPWVQALIAAGYTVYAINPLQVARYRERHSVSGAKSDAADAHTLADMVRTDSHQLRPVAGDTPRHTQRLRHALRDYFPAALEAFEDLDAADALELLAKAPDPASAAKLTIAAITAALTRARRRNITEKAARIQAVLRAEQLGQPEIVTAAYAATTRAAVAVLRTLVEQVKVLQGQVDAHFGQHPDAKIISSQPGLGPILGARVLAEFGDDPDRYTDAKSRKNYAATSPITRASGKKKVVVARFVHNDRLIDALITQAFAALNASPGARTYYDQLKARGTEHHAALRQLANRLVGILHGSLKTRSYYDEATAWAHRVESTAA